MARKGNLFGEKAEITLESERGVNDWAMGDGRNKRLGFVTPGAAMGSLENWGEGAETPEGFADGDLPRYSRPFASVEDAGACDMYGRPIGRRLAEALDPDPIRTLEGFTFFEVQRSSYHRGDEEWQNPPIEEALNDNEDLVWTMAKRASMAPDKVESCGSRREGRGGLHRHRHHDSERRGSDRSRKTTRGRRISFRRQIRLMQILPTHAVWVRPRVICH